MNCDNRDWDPTAESSQLAEGCWRDVDQPVNALASRNFAKTLDVLCRRETDCMKVFDRLFHDGFGPLFLIMDTCDAEGLSEEDRIQTVGKYVVELFAKTA